MNLAEPDNSDLLLLFDYIGKKFSSWEEIGTNWGLKINESLNFPAGGLYAKDYDQAEPNIGSMMGSFHTVYMYGLYLAGFVR